MKIFYENGNYFINDNGEIKICELGSNKDGKPELKLPENSIGRKYFVIRGKLGEIGEIELNPIDRSGEKSAEKSAPKKSKTSNYFDYCTPEELATIEEIKNRALQRMNDPKEKLRREIERKMREIEDMKKQLNNY